MLPNVTNFNNIILIFLVVINYSTKVIQADERIVETEVGRIRGTRANDGNYYQFVGIPYAKVDKENVFGPALPYPNFDDVFDASDATAWCPQPDPWIATPTAVGTLDCLHAYIYVPESANATNTLPVLLYVHGGQFMTGTGNTEENGPRFLVRHDVIVVTLNFRVGWYGFMCVDSPRVSGNQGFKDLIMGLRWINRNIEYFGGDKNKITVFGRSSGAMTIDLLLLADTEELFQQAAVMSGTSFTPQIMIFPNNTYPITIAQRLGLTTNDVDEALSYLNAHDSSQVINAARGLEARPCVELDFDGVDTLFRDVPTNLPILHPNVTFMFGMTSDELIYMYGNMLEEEFNNDRTLDIQIGRLFQFDEKLHSEILSIVKSFYLGDKEYSLDAVFGIANFLSDIRHAYVTERSLAKVLAHGAQKVYYYKFAYLGERNQMKRTYNVTVGGAAHGDDMAYFFDTRTSKGLGTPEDFRMIDIVTTMWTNFAKYGDPTPVRTSLLPVNWEPLTQENQDTRRFLHIDSTMFMDQRPFQERFSFWDLLMKAYGEYEYGVTTLRANSASNATAMLTVLLFGLISVFII